jgi:hypothetical protein
MIMTKIIGVKPKGQAAHAKVVKVKGKKTTKQPKIPKPRKEG